MRPSAALLLLSTACAASRGAGPADDPATALARRVHAAAGGERLSQVAEIDFDFVVEADGQRKLTAHHRWDLVNNSDHVRWTDRQGVAHDVIVHLATRTATAGAEEAKAGYARWVNDSYWLVLPLKLLDPGVVRTLEAPRSYQGKSYQVLRLSFEHVGLTPGDVYWLFIDPESARIERWEMLLEGDQPPAEGTSWEDHRPLGPLVLAHDHVTDDGKRHIRFEATRVLTR